MNQFNLCWNYIIKCAVANQNLIKNEDLFGWCHGTLPKTEIINYCNFC
jgi:hypothetical protein